MTTTDPRRPFGRVLTAMITPFTAAGDLDLDAAQQIAAHLVDEGGNDGLVVCGTTGEASTLSDSEQESVIRAVVEAVGDRATVVAGAGNNDTRHSVDLARTAEKAGAHGLLVVGPYYSKPPQSGILGHFTAVADATGLPVMLYDVPHRTALPVARETFARAAEHPRIVAVKDAKGDLASTSWVLANTDLVYYSGDDVLLLPLLALGAVGIVSVVGHVVGARMRHIVDAFEAGDVDAARKEHASLLPVFEGMFRTQGAILSKAALRLLGLPAGHLRLPLVDATPEEVTALAKDLADGGVTLPAGVGR
jgi:4-hydroxy-tetrahydrodipicolinate synthase